MDGEVQFVASGIDKPWKTWYKVFGDLSAGRSPLVTHHGGPGTVHNYLLSLNLTNVDHTPVVVYICQLGTGQSKHPSDMRGDAEFSTEELFIAQAGGPSWVVSGSETITTCSDIQLPPDVQAAIDKHEAEGTTDSREYQDAVMLLYKRFGRTTRKGRDS
ncbi:hypothetical protein BV20DRAFT_1054371 [Pilatotrama ljubarskyi]|nr:hypothetical protein BV20DRAFT_1054371 [Pilatotrama ljubarskyi]